MPAASAAYLNQALEPTPNSLRSCVASAIGRGSPPAFDGDDKIVSRGRDGLGKRLWASWHVPGQQDRPIVVQDAKVHGAGMQIDTAVKLVLFRIEGHEVSSSLLSDSLPLSAYHRGMLGRGPQ